MTCKNCGKPLNETQYHDDLKSCPNCSVNNGQEHVFYPYPEAYGTTPLRATSKHPDGPQSHCTACRGGNAADGSKSVLCSEK
jgi:hypothetical protein